MNAKKCVLDENKICDDCGECNYCDLNPFKICDNCGKCIGMNEEYREIKIDEIMSAVQKRNPFRVTNIITNTVIAVIHASAMMTVIVNSFACGVHIPC